MDTNYDIMLTPSAKEAVADISEEITRDIIFEAYQIAQLKDTSDKEISLSDILTAKEKLLSDKTRKDKNEYRKRRVSYIIGISGLVYTMIGLFIFVFQHREFDLARDTGLIIAAVGMTFAFFGFFYQLFFSKYFSLVTSRIQEIDYKDDNYDVVKKWQIIEKLTKELMIQKGYDENKSNSFFYLISFLEEMVSSKERRDDLRQLLKTRNKILHENYKLDKNESSDLLKISTEIIDLLESEFKSKTHNSVIEF